MIEKALKKDANNSTFWRLTKKNPISLFICSLPLDWSTSSLEV